MANFYNPKYDTSELIKFTENTVERASFQQIQESLGNKMKEIYGNDIDLTSTTADGQWIMARSLIIDKMFEVITNLQQSLSPTTARGTFLDIVCAFNNVFRKKQSYSTVQCYVRPTNKNIINAYEKTEGGKTWQEIKCIDNNSNIWTWKEYQNVDGSYNTNFNYIPCVAEHSMDSSIVSGKTYYTRSANPISKTNYNGKIIDNEGYEYTPVADPSGSPIDKDYYEIVRDAKIIDTEKYVYTPLTFTCETIGPVNANKGDFNTDDPDEDATNGDVGKTIDINRYPFKVWQVDDTYLGDDIESDESLRTRRELEIGNNSITVLSGLEGALRQIAGIKDVKVINNFSNNIRPTDEGTYPSINGGDHGRIGAHSVYVVIRYEDKVVNENLEAVITDTILNKLTPGVSTEFGIESEENLLYGDKIEKTIQYNIFDVQPSTICWKKCNGQSYPITLNILINKDFNSICYNKIVKAIKNYTREIGLNERLTIGGLVSAINQSCTPVNGVNPYIALNGSIDDATTTQYAENHLSYFDYSDDKVKYGAIEEYSGDNYIQREFEITVR